MVDVAGASMGAYAGFKAYNCKNGETLLRRKMRITIGQLRDWLNRDGTNLLSSELTSMIVEESKDTNNRRRAEGADRVTLVRNCIFAALFCCLLLGPACLFAMQKLAPNEIPPWLSAKSASYFADKNNESGFRSKTTTSGITDKGFQDALQAKIGSYIPMKASALLCNSAIQRFFISSSSALFGWEAYPTFFGSPRFYAPKHDALAIERCPNDYSNVFKFGCGLSGVSRMYPNVSFCLALTDSPGFTPMSPIYDLTREKADTLGIKAALEDGAGEELNIVISLAQYSSTEEYYANHYTTDHHWNGWGTIRSYNEFARDMGLHPIEDAKRNDSLSGLIMNGSSARFGLMLLDEEINEPVLDLSGLSLDANAHAAVLDPDGTHAIKSGYPAVEFDFYERWYAIKKEDSGPSVIHNSLRTDGSTALIVGDSFRNSMQWPIATNYEHTVVVDHMHWLAEGSVSLIDLIEDYGCESVYFIGQLDNYQTFTSRFPEYFTKDRPS